MTMEMPYIRRFLRRYLLGLGSCLATFTVGVFSKAGRMKIFYLYYFFGHRDWPAKLSRVKPENIFKQQTVPVVVHEISAAHGNVTALEMLVISHFVAVTKPKNAFEIGTFDGRTSLNLAANCPTDAHVYTLDLPGDQVDATSKRIDRADRANIMKERSGARFADYPEREQITQLYGDSATFDYEPYNNTIDYVFVDGAHSYDYVVNDTLIALKLLRNGRGVILWHDYDVAPGVTRALNELSDSNQQLRDIKWIEGTTLAYVHLQ